MFHREKSFVYCHHPRHFQLLHYHSERTKYFSSHWELSLSRFPEVLQQPTQTVANEWYQLPLKDEWFHRAGYITSSCLLMLFELFLPCWWMFRFYKRSQIPMTWVAHCPTFPALSCTGRYITKNRIVHSIANVRFCFSTRVNQNNGRFLSLKYILHIIVYWKNNNFIQNTL